MYLVQLLLPLYDNENRPFPGAHYRTLREELTARFGGLTAYSRAPALGLWQDEEQGQVVRDDVVVYEVMTGELDRDWWRDYRKTLKTRFRQDDLLMRAQQVEVL
ncbi:hypothetical protein [Deinococcus peraridilitoris]|uniref:DUF1330 domain-containing protein n=1 Tax=Deinococcus peraridilitoris (strain DSM 19664 / LMG 22246 / CIP 109416 / KR-200) TaxID=937777 RepID=K9ZYM1_DEIPD|nr:hypothetical protein [Deinococcus peraridilitoris]AFZ66299.1 hypothetical protein Deipe_0720 [Deinococcus peraridilitoris DSM 19664]